MKKLLALIICLTITTPAFSDDWEDWSEYADYDEEEIIYEEPIISETSEPASTSIKSNHETYLGLRLYKNESIKNKCSFMVIYDFTVYKINFKSGFYII